MTQDPTDQPAGFGDEAAETAEPAETADETEVEAPLPAGEGASAPADDVADDWIEEAASSDTAALDRAAVAELALAERTLDLQRLQAEYVNYKRRVDRDRELVKQNATFAALAPITEVLDTIDRARDSAQTQGAELDAGFQTVAEQLERVVAGSGLAKFGAVGDAFDPTLHEALSSLGPDPEVAVTTVKLVAKAGYKIGDRVVRAAQVLTVEPG